jgi:hypothetical protein
MARVPLIQEQDHPEFADMIEKFRAGRRGKLINIYRMLLNAPPLAESWFNHSNTVRWKTTLAGRLREIVIIRMGHLANSQYVLRQHVEEGEKYRKLWGLQASITSRGSSGGNPLEGRRRVLRGWGLPTLGRGRLTPRHPVSGAARRP